VRSATFGERWLAAGTRALLIATGTFTADAKAESTRDGAPPVDLIDDLAPCDLLKRYDSGARTTTRRCFSGDDPTVRQVSGRPRPPSGAPWEMPCRCPRMNVERCG
jgi:hypothetical protein